MATKTKTDSAETLPHVAVEGGGVDIGGAPPPPPSYNITLQSDCPCYVYIPAVPCVWLLRLDADNKPYLTPTTQKGVRYGPAK